MTLNLPPPEDHRGRAAIRAWIEDTTSKYAATATPEEVTTAEGAHNVRALVAGNFPGSPIHLTYRFVLDANRIVQLDIG